MGRWDFENERSTGSESANRDDQRVSPSRDDETPRMHVLSERGSIQARDRGDASREHALTSPSGSAREPVRATRAACITCADRKWICSSAQVATARCSRTI
jgi:hypothetical protein